LFGSRQGHGGSRQDQGGVSVEYALIALFIGIAAIVAITLFGGAVLSLFQSGASDTIWGPTP
jgi:Flp pilus assembly pilin Flp